MVTVIQLLPWAALAAVIGSLLLHWRNRAGNRKILAEIRKMDAETTQINYAAQKAAFELSNNHGSSVKDAIDRTEEMVRSIGATQAQMQRDMYQLRGDLQVERKERQQHEHDSSSARAEFNRRMGLVESGLTPPVWSPQSMSSG